MDGDWVMDAARDAHLPEAPDNFISFADADRVDVINVPGIGVRVRGYNVFEPRKRPVILCGVRAPKFISLFEVPQLDAEHGSLDSVHASIPADHRVMILSDLAVIAQDSNLFLQFGVVCHHRAGLAEGSEVFPG